MRSLQRRIGFPPSDNDLANAIDYNVVGNCQFNQRDIRIANKIHGKSVAELKGKSTKRKAKMSRIDMKRDVPKEIMDAYQKIHLDIDIMCVNKVAYLTTISEHIRMTNCVPIKGGEKSRVSDAIERIIEQYNQRGFQVRSMFGDNESRPLKEWLTKRHIDFATCDAKAHACTNN